MAELERKIPRDERAIEIYQWCLDRPDRKFFAREVGGYFPSATNVRAMRMLVDRGLIVEMDCNVSPRVYRLKSVVSIESCLDSPSKELGPPVTRYRVAPSVAGEYSTSDNLQNFAIT